MAKKTGKDLNRLYYGDNLEVMQQHLKDESVDLVYLDPPFNSARAYNVFFNEPDATEDNAQIQGSSDIRWGSWGESAGGEEHAEPVVVPVAVAAGEAAVELDDPVHGLGATVR